MSNRAKIEDFDLCFGVVSAIVERERNDRIEILIQTRWKPDRDTVYSGTLEIPAGGIHRYENVYDALTREVYEETGLKVITFKPDDRTEIFSPREDGAFAFVPFCCQQQLRGGNSVVGFVFICEVENKTPAGNVDEATDLRWVTLRELQRILDETPEQIFTLQLPVLSYYLSQYV